LLCVVPVTSFGQNNSENRNLFIIGGGNRPVYLIRALVSTANLGPDDYIVILSMASSHPDRGTQDIKNQLAKYCNNEIIELNFNKKRAHKKSWVDSVVHARLVYFVGGSQR